MKLNFGSLFLILLFPSLLYAHPLAPTLWEIEEVTPGQFTMLWKTPKAKVVGSQISPVLPKHCESVESQKPTLQSHAILHRSKIQCGKDMVGSVFGAQSIASSKANVLFRLSLADGRQFRSILSPETPWFKIPEKLSRMQVFKDYCSLGVRHILEGLDHLLFILGLLLLVQGMGQLLKTITAFTLGHSITLSLAALGWIGIPQAAMEVLIALSLLYLAFELTRKGLGKISFMGQHPWVLAASFGLLHGMGFAGALMEVGLPQGEIFLGLLGFNLGIEIGQLLFIAGIGVVAWLMGKIKIIPLETIKRISIYGIGSLSVFWLYDRVSLFIQF